MLRKEKRLVLVNTMVITVTFLLFVVALFVKGIQHDVLLESAVFLVSVKLILTTYHIRLLAWKIDERTRHLEELISEQKNSSLWTKGNS